MRGRREKKIIAQTRIPGEITAAREIVDTKWFSHIQRDDSYAALVTARDARREPFHRWLVFKQAYSPELVRRFLRDAKNRDRSPDSPYLLDPFSGTGTFVTECARANFRAFGLENIPSLVYVNRVKSLQSVPSPPDAADISTSSSPDDWHCIADRLTHPFHRAALICAVASQTTARGTVNKSAQPIAQAFSETLADMTRDLLQTLPRANPVLCADARDLSFIADQSVGGILTSPPYLSRHDYARITRPFDEVYAHFLAHDAGHSHEPVTDRAAPQALPASTAARILTLADVRRIPVHPAVAESCDTLNLINQRSLAKLVRAYFQDLFTALAEWRRVLVPKAPCWIVIGGARLKDVYIPSDTILTDHARSNGFRVTSIVAARNLIDTGRKFGRLMNVTPRESVVMLSRD